MEEKNIDPLFKELVEKAFANEKTDFQLIPTNDMYSVTKLFVNGTKKIIKMFKNRLT